MKNEMHRYEEDLFVEADIEFFRKRLTELRKAKGVSERKMSLDLGKAHTFMQNISSGKTLPMLVNFFEICDYFGITPAEFFDPELKNPSISKALYKDLLKLCKSDEDIELFHKIIKCLTPEQFQAFIGLPQSFKNM